MEKIIKKAERKEFKRKVETYTDNVSAEFIMEQYEKENYEVIINYLKALLKFDKINGVMCMELIEKLNFIEKFKDI